VQRRRLLAIENWWFLHDKNFLLIKLMKYTITTFRQILSQAEKAAIVIPPHINEVITGMLLGDSCLRKPTPTGQSAIYIKQADQGFVLFLWNLFKPVRLVGAEPHILSSFDKRTGNTYTAYAFCTFIFPFFAELFLQWYSIINGHSIKHLPANIFELLTPVALAFWIASDGHYMKEQGVVRISTDSFTLSDVQLLQSILLEKFNIQSTINNNGSGKEQYRIRIRKTSIATLQSLVAPHMPPMMAYRVGL
jgi:hypothetical protein